MSRRNPLEKVVLPPNPQQLPSRAHAELAIDMLGMRTRRLRTDLQHPRNLSVLLTRAEQIQHFPLTTRERPDPHRTPRPSRTIRHPDEHLPAPSRDTNTTHDLRRRRVGRQTHAHTEREHPRDIRTRRTMREHDKPNTRRPRPTATRGTQASRDRWRQHTVFIENHNLDPTPSNRTPQRRVIETGADHPQTRVITQDLKQPPADHTPEPTNRDSDPPTALHNNQAPAIS